MTAGKSIGQPLEVAAGLRDRLSVLATSGVPAQRKFVLRHPMEATRHLTAPIVGRKRSHTMGQSDPVATALAEDAYRRTIRRYIPASYAGQVVLFRAQELRVR